MERATMPVTPEDVLDAIQNIKAVDGELTAMVFLLSLSIEVTHQTMHMLFESQITDEQRQAVLCQMMETIGDAVDRGLIPTALRKPGENETAFDTRIRAMKPLFTNLTEKMVDNNRLFVEGLAEERGDDE